MTTAPPTPPATWTTRTLLDWISSKLEERSVDSPRRMAELLLAHVLRCDRLKLYMETDRPTTDHEKATLRELVKRAMNHEPIQYLVGKETFYALEFKVDARALIPRPSTQTIIDAALEHCRPAPDADPDEADQSEIAAVLPLLIADICTGSGCIAVTLAKNLPGAQLIATDISPDALALAAENAQLHELTGRVQFLEGDLLGPLRGIAENGRAFTAIVSNPPYIPDCEWDAVEPNVKDHEPHLALRAGPDALKLISPLIEHAPELLMPGGLLLVELAACSAADALAKAESHPLLENARILKDIDGLDRVLAATRICQ